MSDTTTRIQTIPEFMPTPESVTEKLIQRNSWEMRVAIPGIIQSFDTSTQTVTVQPTINEKINLSSDASWEQLPLLINVPIVIPRAGNFILTVPPQKGDECLVIFQDCCYDAWWQSGGVQNQIELRRHDLSDGIAILGVWSQPNVISNYSTSSAQLRTLDGSTVVDVTDGTITLTATNVKIDSENVTIAGKDFLSHTHSGVTTGSGTTGSVV